MEYESQYAITAMFILGGVDSVYNKIFTQNPIQDGWVLYTDCDCPDGMQYVNNTKKMQITH